MLFLLLLTVAVAVLAAVAKPGPERFERREGKYDDYLVASRFRVELLGKPLATCYGYFGQISCHSDN